MGKVDPSAEVQAMESKRAVEQVTEMTAGFYNGLRGYGLPDEAALCLTQT